MLECRKGVNPEGRGDYVLEERKRNPEGCKESSRWSKTTGKSE